MGTKQLTRMALLIALLCVSAQISFPLPFTPANVTALTLVGCLIAFILPPKEAVLAFIVYLLLGAVGLPVFSLGGSGFGKLLGPTGGFYFSWPIAYGLLSLFKGSKAAFWPYFWKSALITIPITHIMGLLGMMFVLHISFEKAFFMASAPFIFGDLFKCAVAAWLGTKVRF